MKTVNKIQLLKNLSSTYLRKATEQRSKGFNTLAEQCTARSMALDEAVHILESPYYAERVQESIANYK